MSCLPNWEYWEQATVGATDLGPTRLRTAPSSTLNTDIASILLNNLGYVVYSLKAHKVTEIDETRQFDGSSFLTVSAMMENGRLSALLTAIQSHLHPPTPISMREFSEHSIVRYGLCRLLNL